MNLEMNGQENPTVAIGANGNQAKKETKGNRKTSPKVAINGKN